MAMTKDKCGSISVNGVRVSFSWNGSDRTVWPFDVGELSHKARYGVLTKNELLVIASFLDAYTELILLNQEERNFIAGELKKRLKSTKND